MAVAGAARLRIPPTPPELWRVQLQFSLKNIFDYPQKYLLHTQDDNLLASKVLLSKSEVVLEAHEIYEGTISVQLSEHIPVGAYEKIKLTIHSDANHIKENLPQFNKTENGPS